MNKLYILILLATGLLAGCSAETRTITDNYILPSELSDCKVFLLDNGMSAMRVVYCPQAVTTTTHTVGKTTVSNTVIAEDTMGQSNCSQPTVDTSGLGEYQRLKEKFGK